eukprot:8922973-Pyramimonas_sp.AAC.1
MAGLHYRRHLQRHHRHLRDLPAREPVSQQQRAGGEAGVVVGVRGGARAARVLHGSGGDWGRVGSKRWPPSGGARCFQELDVRGAGGEGEHSRH